MVRVRPPFMEPVFPISATIPSRDMKNAGCPIPGATDRFAPLIHASLNDVIRRKQYALGRSLWLNNIWGYGAIINKRIELRPDTLDKLGAGASGNPIRNGQDCDEHPDRTAVSSGTSLQNVNGVRAESTRRSAQAQFLPHPQRKRTTPAGERQRSLEAGLGRRDPVGDGGSGRSHRHDAAGGRPGTRRLQSPSRAAPSRHRPHWRPGTGHPDHRRDDPGYSSAFSPSPGDGRASRATAAIEGRNSFSGAIRATIC